MWIIDSGATLHVTTRKEFFTSYTSGDFRVLKMGNDSESKVIGVGDVCLQINMGVYLLLKGVKHAPDVRFHLILCTCLMMVVMIVPLILESGNSPKVTWLWLDKKNQPNYIGQKLWFLKTL